jgi:hypothetical protein
VHARSCVGVRHAHLGLQPVGVTEEQAEGRAEVGDEAIGRTASDQAAAHLVEGLDRRGLQRQVIEPATIVGM